MILQLYISDELVEEQEVDPGRIMKSEDLKKAINAMSWWMLSNNSDKLIGEIEWEIVGCIESKMNYERIPEPVSFNLIKDKWPI